MRALQRPRAADQAARRRGPARKIADSLGRNCGDSCRPLRVFDHAVIEPKQVAAERLEAAAVAGNESRIVTLLGEKRVRHGQHQRGVGIGADRHPLRAEKVGRVRLERADGHEVDAGLFGAPQPHLHAVSAAAAEGHLAVLEREPAESKDQPRMLDDRRPIRAVGDRAEGADHARQHILRRAEAVIGDLIDAAAAEE